MGKLNNGNYIGVQAFMVRDLHLKGNELLVYALIYGFTQAESQRFTGSLSYIADWTSSTKRGVIKNLKSLLDKGLIAKNEVVLNGVRYCEYYATEFTTSELRDTQNAPRYGTLNPEGGEHSSPKTIDNTIANTNTKVIWRPPTVEEVRAYCKERRNNIDPERFVDYYTSVGWVVGKGKKMKDWRSAVRNWEQRHKEDKPSAERTYDDDFFKTLESRDYGG